MGEGGFITVGPWDSALDLGRRRMFMGIPWDTPSHGGYYGILQMFHNHGGYPKIVLSDLGENTRISIAGGFVMDDLRRTRKMQGGTVISGNVLILT